MRVSVTIQNDEGDKAVDPDKAAAAITKALGAKKADTVHVAVVSAAGAVPVAAPPVAAGLHPAARKLMDWNEIVIAAPAAFLLGFIVGYFVRGKYRVEKTDGP